MAELALVLYQPPPTRELQRRLAQLAHLKADLAALEAEYDATRREIREFERRWRPAVGRRSLELEALREKTKRLRTLIRLAEAGRLEHEPPEEDEEEAADDPTAVFRPPPELRELFRSIARKIHPDRAEDPEDRQRRHEFMAEATRAYRAHDHRRLQWLLERWEASPRLPQGRDPGARITRVNQQIGWTRYRVQEMNHLLAELHGSELAELRRHALEAAAEGRNLTAEMRARIVKELEQAQAEFDGLVEQLGGLGEENEREIRRRLGLV